MGERDVEPPVQHCAVGTREFVTSKDGHALVGHTIICDSRVSALVRSFFGHVVSSQGLAEPGFVEERPVLQRWHIASGETKLKLQNTVECRSILAYVESVERKRAAEHLGKRKDSEAARPLPGDACVETWLACFESFTTVQLPLVEAVRAASSRRFWGLMLRLVPGATLSC